MGRTLDSYQKKNHRILNKIIIPKMNMRRQKKSDLRNRKTDKILNQIIISKKKRI